MNMFFPLPRRDAADDPWVVFDYEIEMYFETTRAGIWVNEQIEQDSTMKMLTIRNAVTESTVLHTRILTDILISKRIDTDDICLTDLLPEWCESDKGKQMIQELKGVYGSARETNTPCWIFNKMLAHPTRQRSNYYDWGNVLNRVNLPIYAILRELLVFTNRFILKHYLS